MSSLHSDKRFEAIAHAAEEKVRQWALGIESQDRLAEQRASGSTERSATQPYLAISREAGAGGSELAERCAEALGWKLLDRELLDYIADHYQLPRDMVEFVDEQTYQWLKEIFGKWIDRRVVTQTEYVRRLEQTALLAARSEPTVFVGRGLQFVMPKDAGLAVRVVAPIGARVERIMRIKELDRREAEVWVNQTDRGRADFVKNYFRRDITDASLYDMVLNLEHLTMDDATEIIVGCCRKKLG